MKYEIILLGKTKETFLNSGINEYLKRLKHYTDVQIKIIKTRKLQGNDDLIKEKEGELILSNLQSATYPIALDSHGKSYSSVEFSEMISHLENLNKRHVTFIIGGPLGLSGRLLSSVKAKISFSKMTFTHDMIRLFLLEQLYRAYTIKAGEKYHK